MGTHRTLRSEAGGGASPREVSEDIAAAAMQATREQRSIDAFISTLQDELLVAGDEIQQGLDLVETFLDDQVGGGARVNLGNTP